MLHNRKGFAIGQIPGSYESNSRMCADYKKDNLSADVLVSLDNIPQDEFPDNDGQETQLVTSEETLESLAYSISKLNEPNLSGDDLTNCLYDVQFHICHNVYGGIDEFLIQTNAVQILMERIDTDTQHCLSILNSLACIARFSDVCFPVIEEYFEKKKIHQLVRSPDLMPPIVAILCFAIDRYSSILPKLIIEKNMLPTLASFVISISNPKFSGALMILISQLFSQFGNMMMQNEISQEMIELVKEKILLAIKTKLCVIDPTYKNDLRVLNSDILVPVLELLDYYLKYFVNNENYQEVLTTEISNAIIYLYSFPEKFDATGHVFCKVLAVMNRILQVVPEFFLNYSDELVHALLDYIKYFQNIRLKLLFLLSNVVKFYQPAVYMLREHKVNDFYLKTDSYTLPERENSIICLLTIMILDPNEFINQLGDNFQNFIEDSCDFINSSISQYYSKMFLNAIYKLFVAVPNSKGMFDQTILFDALSFLVNSEDRDNAEKAQQLIETYFQES